jgi:copper chaperone NosL
MKNFPLAVLARIITILCGLALIVVLFVPLWQIQLAAPQYPEGLVLKMYPHKLGGNVEIINGLNHYIGMKTLHAKNFIEFTVLPYIIGFFAILCLVVAIINKRKWLVTVFILFLVFGVIAMADFYRWNYNYGHDLDPNAAIQVPGMSYQPPLIGYKQLLNFGAYSIPDIGGWIFIGVGLLLLTAVIVQFRKDKKLSPMLQQSKTLAVVGTILIATLTSCNTGPQPIKPGVDACSFCKMTIADKRFGAEIVTKKGKVFKFDDMHCLLAFRKANTISANDIKETYLVNFDEPNNLVEAPKAFLFKSAELRSPMGGNIANFDDSNHLKKVASEMPGEMISWQTLLNQP